MLEPAIPKILILLVNEQRIIREGLRILIESQPGLTVIGEADNCTDVQAIVTCKRPDVILLDLDLHAENSFDFLTEILAVANGTHTLILTSVCDPETYRYALQLGARGIILKDDTI